jgi:hypothetical protein
MLRITQTTHVQAGDALKLEGKLVEPWVSELRDLVQQGGGTRCHFLDVSSVSFIDEAGIELLDRLLDQGFQILSSSSYVAELLRRRRQRDGK